MKPLDKQNIYENDLRSGEAASVIDKTARRTSRWCSLDRWVIESVSTARRVQDDPRGQVSF